MIQLSDHSSTLFLSAALRTVQFLFDAVASVHYTYISIGAAAAVTTRILVIDLIWHLSAHLFSTSPRPSPSPSPSPSRA